MVRRWRRRVGAVVTAAVAEGPRIQLLFADRWGGGPSAVLNEDMRGPGARRRTPRPLRRRRPS